ncbi:uncharacterized protein [Heptranchias perlo]|uniref:uncharacterized protein isoform X2 n=1 Tax=Heptranchias perlo TaxID=212740 RepID=UPI00355A7849
MALAFAGRCLRTHQGRDTGDWARKVIVGGGLRHDWYPGNNLGPVEAEVRQEPGGRLETNCQQERAGTRGGGSGSAPPPPLPVAVELSAQGGAIADPWQAPFTPRDNPRWGSALIGGRAVQRLSQALAVLHLYCTQQVSVNVPLGKGYPSVKPSETVGSTKFPSNGDSFFGARALGDNNAYIAKGFANHGSCRSYHSLFSQRMNDKCQHGLWSFRTFKRLILTNACASPQDGNGYWHHHYSVIKALHQCRMYGHFKDGKRYSNGSNAVPLPRGSNTVYYDILKIPPNATQSQIKSAYYKQSLIYHPDKNAGSEEAALRFTQINEAYSVLGSVILRKKYDRGILTAGDLHMGKRPLEKAQGSTPRQSQAKSSPDKFDSGKLKFNFDEFYKAHYREQLEKEQILRERKLQAWWFENGYP